MTRSIEIGTEPGPGGQTPALLDLEELLATRLLVQGNSGSGKSHLLRRLLEQSAEHVQQLVVDPEGEFAGLGERFGHVIIDADRAPAELEGIALRIRQHRVSAVLSLETLDAEQQMRAAGLFLNALFDAERDHWYPMLVVVDEAQLFAPAVAGDVGEEARRLSLGAMTNLMCRGRKRGLAGVIATQRLAKLAKNVAAEASNFLMGRTFLDIDMMRAADLLGLERRQADMFRELQRGQFVALGPALSRRPRPIRVGPVETAPSAAIPKLMPLPEPPSESVRDLVLAPVPAAARPVPERRAPAPVAQVLDAIEAAPAPFELHETARAEAPPALSADERLQALLAIACAVMAEPDAPFRPEPVLFQDLQLRWRLSRPGTAPVTLAEARLPLQAGRAGIDPASVDGEAWGRALAVARRIPEDLQAVYLIIAGAALTGAPCPSDHDIARRCGMHSAGRARSRLNHLDKADLVVLRTDMSGRRAAVLPDLGWETAPGDPQAPAGSTLGLAAE